jgi:hypothetical protein
MRRLFYSCVIFMMCHAVAAEFGGDSATSVPAEPSHRVTLAVAKCACDTAASRALLMELFASTSGDQWTTHTNWNTTSCTSTWYGVTCSRQGLFTSLTLPNNNLRGILPESLGNLTTLTTISLYGNQLTGTLHSSWSSLTNLTVLFLHQNSLSGTLPASWQSLTKWSSCT